MADSRGEHTDVIMALLSHTGRYGVASAWMGGESRPWFAGTRQLPDKNDSRVSQMNWHACVVRTQYIYIYSTIVD